MPCTSVWWVHANYDWASPNQVTYSSWYYPRHSIKASGPVISSAFNTIAVMLWLPCHSTEAFKARPGARSNPSKWACQVSHSPFCPFVRPPVAQSGTAKHPPARTHLSLAPFRHPLVGQFQLKVWLELKFAS